MRHYIAIIILLLTYLPCFADTTRYAEQTGLTRWRLQQVLQDGQGFLWLSTWNGLYRFDGYGFHNFKSHPGDGTDMVSDRVRDLWQGRPGELLCLIDQDWYRFNLRTCRFTACTAAEARRERSVKAKFIRRKENVFTDRQGLRWFAEDDALCKDREVERRWKSLPQERPTPVGALCMAGDGGYWVSTKGDATLRRYSRDGRLKGYMGDDGRIHGQYTSMRTPAYCIYHAADGTMWLGCKPGGLLSCGREGMRHWPLPVDSVYDVREDRHGRLWVATFGAGLLYIENGKVCRPRNYPRTEKARVRHICIVGDTLLAATTEGLIVGDVGGGEPLFRLHRREAGRSTSLSCNATMDICRDTRGRIWVTTESGGLNLITSSRLDDSQLEFRHFTRGDGLPTDVLLSATPLADGSLLLVGDRRLVRFTVDGWQNFGEGWFGESVTFSDAHPIMLADSVLLIGRMDGALTLPVKALSLSRFVPPLVLTGISIQNGVMRSDVAYLDTLTMQADERNLTVCFSALDYRGPEGIRYSIRMDNSSWTDLGETHQATFLDLSPGTHLLEICSTNADGMAADNTRRLTVVVTPRLTETVLFKIMILLLLAGVVYAVVRTVRYIRAIRRKQQETLDLYMALLERNAAEQTAPLPPDDTHEEPQETPQTEVEAALQPSVTAEDEAFMGRVLAFVEANIGNSDADVDGMAHAALVSRSVLNRKMKALMNVTPNQFLMEARLQRAAALLQTKRFTVSETAWKCGFSDPKYFSKCFKAWSGKSPSQY